MHRFTDRRDAGRQLARQLAHLRRSSPIVLGLPRGGVPVADEVAQALDAPLDVWVVRKVGAPIQPELGVGAVAEGGELYLDDWIIAETGTTAADVDRIVADKLREIDERVRVFRRGGPQPDLRDRVVIVVDDGLATGGTARAALRSLRRRGVRKLVLAVPVAAAETVDAMRSEADEIVCLQPEPYFRAVGLWYVDFAQVEDSEVLQILDAARARRSSAHALTRGSQPSHEPRASR